MKLRVTDHALVRFLEVAGGIDVEAFRSHVERGLQRAHQAAAQMGVGEYLIRSNGLTFIVRRDGNICSVTSVLEARTSGYRAKLLNEDVRKDREPE